MNEFKGSQSEKNIMSAFAGESQARNRYTFFAEQARSEGNTEVAELFEKMAHNEMFHAKIWFRLMHDGLGDSAANIQEAARGENQEWRSMYPEFAEIAREEGFEQLAETFEQVANIERDHERTFLKAFVSLQSRQIGVELPDASEKKTVYRCMFCGAVFEERPDLCPVCEAIGSFESLETDA